MLGISATLACSKTETIKNYVCLVYIIYTDILLLLLGTPSQSHVLVFP